MGRKQYFFAYQAVRTKHGIAGLNTAYALFWLQVKAEHLDLVYVLRFRL